MEPKKLASRRVAWFGNGAPRVAGVSEGIRNDSEADPEPGQSESWHCMSVPRLNSWVVDEEGKCQLWVQVEEEAPPGGPTRDAVPRVVSSLTEKEQAAQVSRMIATGDTRPWIGSSDSSREPVQAARSRQREMEGTRTRETKRKTKTNCRAGRMPARPGKGRKEVVQRARGQATIRK